MILLSILIPTMVSRRKVCAAMQATLQKQIKEAGGEKEVEVVLLEDEGEISIGVKRGKMFEMAKGLFSVFLDDDDPVADTYVRSFLEVLRVYKGEIDCIGIFEKVYFQDEFAGWGMHSSFCDVWTEGGGFYYRHLDQRTPVKTELARKIKYRDIRWAEDHHWSVDAAKSGLFKKEVFLGAVPLYEYRCRSKKKGL